MPLHTQPRFLVLALATAAALALGCWALFLRAPGEDAHGPTAGPASRSDEAATALASPRGPANDSATRAAARAGADAARGGESAAMTALADEIRGRVVDELAHPIAGAEVEAREALDASLNTYDLEFTPPASARARATTDADGRFRLVLAPERAFSIAAAATGRAQVVTGHVYAGQNIEIQLEAACSVRGFVTRARDDTPVADARVRVFHGPADQEALTHTDARGFYYLEGLVPGEAWLQVVPPTLAMPRLVELSLERGATLEQDVALEPGWEVTGQVRDARTRNGIPDAEVSCWSFLGKNVRTDAFGFYRLQGARPSQGTLVARAPGYGRLEQRLREDREVVDFELTPGFSVSGRVLEPSGTALEGALVSACASATDQGLQRLEWKTTVTDLEGRFRIDDLRTDLAMLLFVRKPAFATALLPLPAAAPGLRDVAVGDITLAPQAVLAGRVMDGDGRPVAFAQIELRGPQGTSSETRAELDVYVKVRQVDTDERGCFTFADLAPGEYRARVRSSGHCETEALARLAEGEQRRDVQWLASGGGALRGVVLGPDGTALESATVALRSSPGVPPASATARTDERGEFELDGLCASSYTLRASADAGAAVAPAVRLGVEPDGSYVELRLAARDTALAGRVVDADGAAVSDVLVAIDWGDDAVYEGVLTDAAGLFQMLVPGGQTVDVRAWRTGVLDLNDGTPTVLEWELQRRILDREHPGAVLRAAAATGSVVELRLESHASESGDC